MKRKHIILIIVLILSLPLFADYARDIELGRRFIVLEKYQEARDVLEPHLAEHSDDSALRTMLKNVYTALKDYEALLPILEDEVARNPKDARLWLELGQLHLSQGNSDEAKKAFDTATQLAPDNRAIVISIFNYYRTWGYIKEGIAILSEARKNSDDPALYAMEMASMYEILGDWAAATDEYGLYLEKHPDRFADVERRMNEIAADPDQLEELEIALEKLRKRGIQGDRIDRLIARIQARQGKYVKAVKSLIQAEKKRGTKGMYLLSFMREAQDADAHEAVIAAGRYLSDAEPHIASDAELTMARSFKELERIDEAMGILKRLIKNKNPVIAAGALTLMGQIELYNLGEPNAAEGHLKEAIDRYGHHPDARDAYRSLNDLYIKRGDFDAAYAILRERRALAPQDSWALFGIGELAFYRGSIDTAAAVFQTVALSFPKSEEANDAVEYLALFADIDTTLIEQIVEAFKLKRQGRPAEALESFDAIIEKLDDESWGDLILWNRALLLLDMGLTPRAENDLERITNDYSGGYHASRALELLGDIALDKGDPTAAIEFYNRILVEYPDAVNLESVRAKIRSMPGNI